MHGLIRETVFGRLVHLASRGKLFPQEEQRDPSRLQRYMMTESASTSETCVQAATDSLEGEKVDTEKGSDFQLVDWIENDPEVRDLFNISQEFCLNRSRIPGIGRLPRNSSLLSRSVS